MIFLIGPEVVDWWKKPDVKKSQETVPFRRYRNAPNSGHFLNFNWTLKQVGIFVAQKYILAKVGGNPILEIQAIKNVGFWVFGTFFFLRQWPKFVPMRQIPVTTSIFLNMAEIW